MRAILVASLALAACTSEQRCRDEAAALTKLLREANIDPPVFYEGDAKLVVRRDLPKQAIERRPADLILQPGLARLRFDAIRDDQQLASELAALRRSTGSNRIYLLIDAATPWQEVVRAVQAAELAGFTAPAFVFQSEVKLTPPPRSAIDDKLDAIEKDDPAERATKVAQLVEKEVESCPALQRAFSAVSGEDTDKAAILIEGLGEGLVECRCRVNIGALRSVMWRVLANPRPHRVLALDNSGGATTKISLAAQTPWSEASTRLPADLKSASFEVAPAPR